MTVGLDSSNTSRQGLLLHLVALLLHFSYLSSVTIWSMCPFSFLNKGPPFLQWFFFSPTVWILWMVEQEHRKIIKIPTLELKGTDTVYKQRNWNWKNWLIRNDTASNYTNSQSSTPSTISCYSSLLSSMWP